ncbi:Poly(rC)-binding protein 2 [Pteropus alecto]|uniref:Poly(RC)-binding protein 2 n=1 Tax=Pteropus alecto TaxID=9402 RepID=L5JZE0_PTEAL|nr:Poly(rC)-binding protein 2 [Pteropus alecto]
MDFTTQPKPATALCGVVSADGKIAYPPGVKEITDKITTDEMIKRLKGPPLDSCTIQSQYAIPQPDLTKLHQLAMQQSHFPMTHANTRSSADLDASAQTTSHELTIPNDLLAA